MDWRAMLDKALPLDDEPFEDAPTVEYEPIAGVPAADLPELDAGPIETTEAPVGHPTETPAPYRELQFPATSLDAPDPVSATPPPVESWTPRPLHPATRPAVGRAGVAWVRDPSHRPRDPAEITSEILVVDLEPAPPVGRLGELEIDDSPLPLPPLSPADLAQEVAGLSHAIASIDARIQGIADEVNRASLADLKGASQVLDTHKEIRALARDEADDVYRRSRNREKQLDRFLGVLTAAVSALCTIVVVDPRAEKLFRLLVDVLLGGG